MSTILNPGTTPVIYTDDARVIEAGTRLYDVDLDDTGQQAVTHGYLVEEEVASDAPTDEDKAPTGDASGDNIAADDPPSPA